MGTSPASRHCLSSEGLLLWRGLLGPTGTGLPAESSRHPGPGTPAARGRGPKHARRPCTPRPSRNAVGPPQGTSSSKAGARLCSRQQLIVRLSPRCRAPLCPTGPGGQGRTKSTSRAPTRRQVRTSPKVRFCCHFRVDSGVEDSLAGLPFLVMP